MAQGEGGGPKPIVFDDDQIKQVEALAAYLNVNQMADYFGISQPTFDAIRERQPEVSFAYKQGKAKAIGSVAKGLLMQAREGNASAAMFYLKTQAGWKETQVVEGTGKDGAIVLRWES